MLAMQMLTEKLKEVYVRHLVILSPNITYTFFLFIFRWLAWHRDVLMQLFHTLMRENNLAKKYGISR